MNPIKFVKEMIELDSALGYISLAYIGIFLLCIVWNMLRGYRRGIVRQSLHFGFTVIAAVIAFLIANRVASLTTDDFLKLMNIEVAEGSDGYLAFAGIPITDIPLQFILKVLFAPIVFTVSFCVINPLLKIVYLIIIGIFHIEKGESRAIKLPGLFLGIIEGFVIGWILLLPLAGVAGTASDTYEIVEDSQIFEKLGDEGEAKGELENIYHDYIVPISANPVFNMIDKCGGDLLLDRFATVEEEAYTVNLRDELTSVLRLVFADVPALIETDWMSLTEEDKTAISGVVDFVSGSPYRASIFAPILSMLAAPSEAIDPDGATDVQDSFFSIFEDLDGESLPGVLNTFKDFYFLASDEGILLGLSQGDDTVLTDAFTKTDENGVTTLTKMIDILNGNERTAVLVNALTEMTITMLSESMGLDANAVVKYNDIKDSLNSTLTSIDTSKPKEEQVADVSASLADAFEKNDMAVEPEIIEKLAENIVENHADGSEITDAEFNDIILHYYEANKEVLDSSAQ